MAIGGHGGFSWIENIAPGLVSVPLFKALKKNDYEKAREILFKYRDLIDLFNVLDPVPVNIHFMLNSMGWKMGIPRAPYAYPPSKENQERYLSVLRKYKLIKK
jgi:dihydrodipicolinate synthase/N-acetylneuraminate lyase